MERKANEKSKPEQPLLSLTEAAVTKVQSMMEKDGKAGCGLRIGVVTGGCAGLSYDLRFQKKPYDNDVVIKQNGLTIFINEESKSFLKGTTIDYIDTLKESGFKYNNPNAQSSCGCGTSFS